MKILYFTLKAKWYDMIDAGIKLEEYREINSYWAKRLGYVNDGEPDYESGYASMMFTKDFTHVHFARGGHFHPSLPQMRFELEDIVVATGKPEWGAEPNKKYFVSRLGERVSIEQSAQECDAREAQ